MTLVCDGGRWITIDLGQSRVWSSCRRVTNFLVGIHGWQSTRRTTRWKKMRSRWEDTSCCPGMTVRVYCTGVCVSEVYLMMQWTTLGCAFLKKWFAIIKGCFSTCLLQNYCHHLWETIISSSNSKLQQEDNKQKEEWVWRWVPYGLEQSKEIAVFLRW